MNLHAFPKIFTIGQDYIKDIFNNEVEITEKIDGSQFVFGLIEGELQCRSKGQTLYIEEPDKMFAKAVDYVVSIRHQLPDNTIFFCEYLQKPHHNVLSYSRVPKNNLILFGVSDNTGTYFKKDWSILNSYADQAGIEMVPLLYKGKIDTIDQITKLLDTDSILGNTKIEGIVAKNYQQPFLLGGQPIPLMMGKYVSEKFKEVHREKWGSEHTHAGAWDTFKRSFCTEARWQKSVQHMKDAGELKNSPQDIGKLILAIKKDIAEEEKEDIKNFLWKEFGDELLRGSTKGAPEWYKEQLLKSSFPNEETKEKI
jgi:hypothetical protein